MENLLNPDESKSMQVDPPAFNHLQETRKWTSFISIVGFVFIGLMAVAAIAIPSLGGMSSLGPGSGFSMVFTIIMLIFVVIYFFPIYYLNSFSRYARLAVTNNDASAFTEAMRFLKLHYRFMGILIIIVLSIYLLVFIIGFMAGSLVNMFN